MAHQLGQMRGPLCGQDRQIRRVQPFQHGQVKAERGHPAGRQVEVGPEDAALEQIDPLGEAQSPAGLGLGLAQQPAIGGRQQDARAAGAVVDALGQEIGRLRQGQVHHQHRQVARRVVGPHVTLVIRQERLVDARDQLDRDKAEVVLPEVLLVRDQVHAAQESMQARDRGRGQLLPEGLGLRAGLEQVTIEVGLEAIEQPAHARDVAAPHEGEQRLHVMVAPIGLAGDPAVLEVGYEHHLRHQQLGIDLAQAMAFQLAHHDLQVLQQHPIHPPFGGKPGRPGHEDLAGLDVRPGEGAGGGRVGEREGFARQGPRNHG